MTRPTHSNLYLYIHFLFDFFIYFNISTSLLVSWWLILRIPIPTHYKKFLDPHMISLLHFFSLSLDPRPDIPCPINSYLTINPPFISLPFLALCLSPFFIPLPSLALCLSSLAFFSSSSLSASSFFLLSSSSACLCLSSSALASAKIFS